MIAATAPPHTSRNEPPGGPGRGSGAISPQRLRSELRRTLASTTARGAPFTVLGVVLVVLIVHDDGGGLTLPLWVAYMMVLCMSRTVHSLVSMRRNLTDRRWYEPSAALLAGLTGLGWGAIPYLFGLPPSSNELTALTIIGCGVIITGALTSAPSRLTLAAYSLPVLVAQGAFNLQQTLLSEYWLGAAVAAFFLFSWAMSDRYRSEIMHRLRSQDAEQEVRARLERQAAEMSALAGRYRDEAERAEAASRAKSLFLANVSHEIRTPLNGVLGMTAALSQTGLQPRQQEMVGVVEQSGRELLHLLDDILDLSRIEAGKLSIAPRPFDLPALLRGTVEGYAEEAGRKGLALRLEIGPEAEGRHLADPVRLRQVLQNLLSNALKFTASGSILLRAGAAPEGASAGSAGDGRLLAFEVRDSGIGIPPGEQTRIFDAFEQADSSSTRRHGGTGLGLAICRQLVAMMGGTIAVESSPGQGAAFRFTVRVQAAPVEAVPAALPQGPGRLLLPDGRGGERAARILAAEDSQTNQLVLQALLAPTGAALTMTGDGLALLAAWEAAWAEEEGGRGAAADLILMDVRMPELDGLDATRELRRREAASGRRRTPVLALTANVMAHQVSEYLAAGMDATAAKPLERQALVRAIAALLGLPQERAVAVAAPAPAGRRQAGSGGA